MTATTCHLCRSTELRPHFRSGGHRYLRCGRCGLIAREGIEPLRARGEYETDAYQRGQPARLALREAIFRQALEAIERRHRFTRNVSGRLLDVGCGDGLFLKLAAK